MKKIILIAVVAVAVTSACRKERTCDCTITTTSTSPSGSATTSYTQKTTVDKQKAKEFREINNCYDYLTTQTFTNQVTTTVDHKCTVN